MPPQKTFDETEIETTKSRIRHTVVELNKIASWLLVAASVGFDVRVCHRVDNDANGTVVPCYYIEIGEMDFIAMGGVKLDKE